MGRKEAERKRESVIRYLHILFYLPAPTCHDGEIFFFSHRLTLLASANAEKSLFSLSLDLAPGNKRAAAATVSHLETKRPAAEYGGVNGGMEGL